MRKSTLLFILISIISSCGEQQNTPNIPKESFDYSVLKSELDSIYNDDQNYRLALDDLEEKYAWDSDEVQAQWQLIHIKDSLNLIKIEKILEKHGWLGEDEIGSQGNATLFLVIQHAPIEAQEKYLPIMRDAVNKGKAFAYDLALLEDRIAMRNGKKQIYGSQILFDEKTGKSYVHPLIEPDSINARRAKVGLGTIENYVKMFDIFWDLEAHKKRVKEFEMNKMNK